MSDSMRETAGVLDSIARADRALAESVSVFVVPAPNGGQRASRPTPLLRAAGL
jgi:hypothetical protein